MCLLQGKDVPTSLTTSHLGKLGNIAEKTRLRGHQAEPFTLSTRFECERA